MSAAAGLDTAIGVARSLVVYYGQPWRRVQLRRFYSGIIKPGDLVFDIGAHVGSRSRTLLSLGAEVVAVEPQPVFADMIEKHLASRLKGFERAAVGATEGEARLRISRRHPTVSTVSERFVESVSHAEGFRDVVWDHEVVVPMTTPDRLIEKYGIPAFCKIDVEGAEADILRGLSSPIRLVAFEYNPALPEIAHDVIGLLEKLGSYRFNRVVGERHRFENEEWRDAAALLNDLSSLAPGDPSGDVYARLAT
ncbi:FkbM family methyltransferase [Pseudorhizobium flavum]|uniref:FkbM family methyltransferase n=1 Tax=Pseudorhizobium flavum TaxID=1335061 RepID=A0A7W9YVR2_9HYPH|nr:FkbM family methyltransferase [Pseudorhizobium flavum]MBB6179248.1 FkbM family methyltransferase [Pseudorhizobium flavum]CAD6603966.1 FkbM family methyltransferase [Pseudorhizobium flavum]